MNMYNAQRKIMKHLEILMTIKFKQQQGKQNKEE